MAGDPTVLPAVVRVEMGTIALATGETELGEWKLYQVGMSELDDWIVLEIESEKVYLDLPERARFLDETKTYRRDESKRGRTRRREHPAFVKEPPTPPQVSPPPGPAMVEKIRSEMIEEAVPLLEEGRKLLDKIPRGWPLALIIGGVIIASVFVPFLAGIMFGLCMAVGVVAVLAGGVGYVDTGFGVRYPEKLSPARLMIYGAVLLILSVPFAMISG